MFELYTSTLIMGFQMVCSVSILWPMTLEIMKILILSQHNLRKTERVVPCLVDL